MNRFDIALFDLDGTLSESGEGILSCVEKVFEEMNKPLPDKDTLASFIGPPMYDSLHRCGFSETEALKGVEIYKRNFVESGIYKNKVYDGIPEVLSTLKKHGVRMGVASTKYQLFTDRIISMLNIDGYFDIIGGSNSLTTPDESGEKPRHNKIEVMEYVISSLGGSDRNRIVMIGDTRFDADGAAAAGTAFIGCTFGYGSKKEMEEYYTSGTPFFAETPTDILKFII